MKTTINGTVYDTERSDLLATRASEHEYCEYYLTEEGNGFSIHTLTDDDTVYGVARTWEEVIDFFDEAQLYERD